MLYQKLLTGQKPYFVTIGHFCGFPVHRHSELEIHYCIQGNYNIHVANDIYSLRQGDIAVVGSMISHEMPDGNTDSRGLLINVGPVLLKDDFSLFSDVVFASPIYRPDDKDERAAELAKRVGELCAEIVAEYTCRGPATELQILGNLYKICGCFMEEILEDKNIARKHPKEFKAVANIENALGLIYNNYYENITVEDAAALTGYKKSNFCKIFKNIVGDSFHQVLNRHRVEIASFFCGKPIPPLKKSRNP